MTMQTQNGAKEKDRPSSGMDSGTENGSRKHPEHKTADPEPCVVCRKKWVDRYGYIDICKNCEHKAGGTKHDHGKG